MLQMLLMIASIGQVDNGLSIHWENNYLTISGNDIPGGPIEIHYLEAYCRSGSTDRDWRETVIPHQTKLILAEGKQIRLRCKVESSIVVDHEITAGVDDVTFRLHAENMGDEYVDVVWAQPCVRVDGFTGMKQDDYWRRCFIFTEKGLTMMPDTERAEKARYIPGQVYVPANVDRNDVIHVHSVQPFQKTD
jgi:hypothetical protein